jgi:hypothetical protein
LTDDLFIDELDDDDEEKPDPKSCWERITDTVTSNSNTVEVAYWDSIN